MIRAFRKISASIKARTRRPGSRLSRTRTFGPEGLEPRALLAVTTQYATVLNPTNNPSLDPVAVATDSAGSTYVAGSHFGDLTIAPISLSLGGSQYVARLDGAGRAIWVKDLDKLNVTAIAVDPAGNVYVAATTDGSPNSQVLNPNGIPNDVPITLNNEGNQMALLLKFDARGAYLGRKLFTWGAPKDSGGNVRTESLAIDPVANNLYLTMSYSGPLVDDGDNIFTVNSLEADFDGSQTNLLDATHSTAVVCMALNGSVKWARGMGGSNSRIALDPTGKIYVAGTVAGAPQQFDVAGAPPVILSPPSGQTQTFLATMDRRDGSILTAAKVAQGSSYSMRQVVADAAGNAYITGDYRNSVQVGNASLSGLANLSRGFLARVTTSGSTAWSTTFTGSGNISTVGLVFDGVDQLFVAGNYSGTATFGKTKLTSAGSSSQDLFLTEFDTSGKEIVTQGGGGTGSDSVDGIAMSSSNRIALTGTVSTSNPGATIGGVRLSSFGSFAARLALVRPTATVAALPATTRATSFPVSWSGSSPAGIAQYTVFVATDGGAMVPWLVGTTATQANFAGADGHSYGFSVVAVDNTGLASSFPAAAQASTALQTTAPTAIGVQVGPTSATQGDALTLTATVTTAAAWAGAPSGSVQFLLDGQPVGGPVALAGGTASLVTSIATSGAHQFSAVFQPNAPFVASASAAVPISIAARPAVTVASVTAIRVKKQITGFQMTFTGPVDAASAALLANYELVTPGPSGKFGKKGEKRFVLSASSYDPATGIVRLTTKKKMTATGAYRLRMIATATGGVRDAYGRGVDGNRDGTPAGDAYYVLRRGAVQRTTATAP